jgi:hypothetical protein
MKTTISINFRLPDSISHVNALSTIESSLESPLHPHHSPTTCPPDSLPPFKMPTPITDDKSPHVIPFILSRLAVHRAKHAAAGTQAPPFVLGVNGVQGAGKTTLVRGFLPALSI